MNSQIQKLINSNSLSRTQIWDTEAEKYAEVVVDQEKFAELIVQECIKETLNYLNCNDSILGYTTAIRKHFGLK